MTINQYNPPAPFAWIAALDDDPTGTMVFGDMETGEILSFPPSWSQDMEGVDRILRANLAGDYEEQGVLFGNCEFVDLD
jgi:hypothetical protein